MDYKYIEQLLERYWQCETSVEEERILRAFFQQKEVPAHLLPYRALFAYQQAASEAGPGQEFDERVLAEIERPVTTALRTGLRSRLQPLLRAAAVIAIVFGLGTGTRYLYMPDEATEPAATYTDTYTDPHTAYGTVSDALMRVSASLQKSQTYRGDTVQATTPNGQVQ